MPTLEEKIEELRKENYTEEYSMSIGEVSRLYEKMDIDIHPKFQRFLRWSDEQKSRLIESVLLRIPIPPIFVSQDPEGKWDVVDGVQRLGTILEFMGLLKEEDGSLRDPLVLRGTHLLPQLEGKTFAPKISKKKKTASSDETHFSSVLQRDFERAKLSIVIVLRESDPTSKYELFMRLNTGGSKATDQEVRNCLLVWLNEEFYDWFMKLSHNQNFIDCIDISDRLLEESYDCELAFRFLAFIHMGDEEFKQINNISDFLDKKARVFAMGKFNKKAEERLFKRTFDAIARVGSSCFKRFDSKKNEFVGPFLTSAFEAVASGVAHNIDYVESQTPEWLESRIQKMWIDKIFTPKWGAGKTPSYRIQRTIPFGRDWFSKRREK